MNLDFNFNEKTKLKNWWMQVKNNFTAIQNWVNALENKGVKTSHIADSAVTAVKIASNAVTTDKIADKNVTTAKLADKSVTTAKIADYAVNADQIATDAITESKIHEGSVSGRKIAQNAITADKINSNAVTTPKILDKSVTTAKLSDGAVTTEKIADESITTAKIADDAITKDKIADNAVQYEHIANLAVDNRHIAGKAVRTAELDENAVTMAKLADEVKEKINAGSDSTIVVASSASKNKARADYVCGSADNQTEINKAIKALPETGGKIVLLEGTYSISGTINVNKPNVTIEGMGASTILKRRWNASFSSVISISADYCTLSDFTMDGARDLYSAEQYLITADTSNPPKYSTIRNLNIINSFDGIVIGAGSHHLITDCYIDYTKNGRIGIRWSNASGVIVNNTIMGAGQGIQTAGHSNILVANNRIVDADTGIMMYGSYSEICGNYIVRGAGQSSDYESIHQTIELGSDARYNNIHGNYILGRNYINSGGTTNTFNNNRYQ